MNNKQIGIEVLYTPYFIKEDFRKIIARCSNLTPELIHILSMDADCTVRFNIAERGDLTPEQVERLSKDKEWFVRNKIANNPHAQEILNNK